MRERMLEVALRATVLHDATGRTGQLIHTLDPRLNVGLISPGYSADLIVLTADPLADITNTRHIAAVYHRGKLIANPPPVQ